MPRTVPVVEWVGNPRKECPQEWGHGSLKGRSTVGFPEKSQRRGGRRIQGLARVARGGGRERGGSAEKSILASGRDEFAGLGQG